jgi:hypothetical protein
MTAVSANPASISATVSTILTATVKPAGGATAPTGVITFSNGTATLGTATLTPAGSGSTATLAVKGSQLVAGSNTIKASYAGSTTFSASAGTTAVTLTGTTLNSKVTVTITPNPVVQQREGWLFTIQLLNGGGATALTSFTVNGTSYAGQIPMFFGSSNIAVNGKLASSLKMTNVPAPTSVVFGFGGTDATGITWIQNVNVDFQKAVRDERGAR